MKMKKDPDYVAAVERAISEKYGKTAAQDFRNEWEENKEKDYLQQLKAMKRKIDKNMSTKEEVLVGDVRIAKRRGKASADRTCPVCKTYSFSGRDDLYMNRFKSCHDCYIDFIIGREDAWKSGERPAQEVVETAKRRR